MHFAYKATDWINGYSPAFILFFLLPEGKKLLVRSLFIYMCLMVPDIHYLRGDGNRTIALNANSRASAFYKLVRLDDGSPFVSSSYFASLKRFSSFSFHAWMNSFFHSNFCMVMSFKNPLEKPFKLQRRKLDNWISSDVTIMVITYKSMHLYELVKPYSKIMILNASIYDSNALFSTLKIDCI